MTHAILHFFEIGKLLIELNVIVLALIPKVNCPSSVVEFRPIMCYNVLYKCITKMICSRLKLVLPDIIAENHEAFIIGFFSRTKYS